jgi:hypothetical protein
MATPQFQPPVQAPKLEQLARSLDRPADARSSRVGRDAESAIACRPLGNGFAVDVGMCGLLHRVNFLPNVFESLSRAKTRFVFQPRLFLFCANVLRLFSGAFRFFCRSFHGVQPGALNDGLLRQSVEPL